MRTLLLNTLCLLALAFTLHGSIVYAVERPYIPLAPIDVQGSQFTSQQYNPAIPECKPPTCFPRYLRTIYNVGIMLAGLFAVISIVRGGFTLMWTDSFLGHSEAKGIILRALGGLLIVYSSYIFMNTINPALGRDLDLSLNFPHVPETPKAELLKVVTAEDVEAQLKKQFDTVNPQIRALVTERDAKSKLAKEKRAAADKSGLRPEIKQELLDEAAALEGEANTLDDQQELLGNTNAPSERIKSNYKNALTALWDTDHDATYVIDLPVYGKISVGTASKTQRLDEANRLLGEMEKERDKIKTLPDGPNKVAVLKELDDTKTELQNQIRYLKNGCDRATGMLTKTFSTGGSGPPVKQTVACPP